MITPSEEEGET